MSKVRVYEVAKQLNMDQKALVAAFQSMGLGDVRNHMSAVEVDVVERLKRQLERQKAAEVVEERIRPTVVKRRARATEGGDVPAPRPSSPGADAATEDASTRRAPASDDVRIEHEVPAPDPSRTTLEVPPSKPSRGAAPSSVATRGRPSSRASAKTATTDLDFDAEVGAPVVPPAPAPAPAGAAPVASAETSEPRELVPPKPSSRGSRNMPRIEPSRADGDAAEAAPVAAARDAVTIAATPAAIHEALASLSEPEPPSAPPAPAPAPAPVRTPGLAAVAPTPAPVAVAPSVPPPSEGPKRPSSPPRTGIDVWQGRPGVPMPQTRSTPPARRTTYDPRASVAPGRPGAPSMFPQRPGMPGRPGGGQRPGFGAFGSRGGRPMPSMSTGKRTPQTEMAAHKKVIKIEESVSLQKLASMMSLKVTDVLMKLLGMGMPGVNINSTIDSDTAKILAGEFGWTVEDVAVTEEQTLEAAMGLDDRSDQELFPRPPIVTVMGHVDHGKTSLLDRIRKTSVAAGEAGGITQHIGAYRVETSKGLLAFLDTPGHEAFTSMRARGAQVTDIVVLVVAADDGVMPQTREAINHAQAAKVPIIVAINKIDKPSAEPDRVKRDLSGLGLTPEEWGGETLFVPVSALTGEGVEQLLESIALQSEVLELRAAPKRRGQGVVIEALLDRGRGPVARVLVQDGTLRVGDILLAGAAVGKIRAMTDELGRSVATAGPSTPVEVLGLNEVPSAGDPVHAVKDAKTAEEIAEQRRKKQSKSLIPQDSRVSLDALTQRLSEAEQLELKLIIKGDVQGSVEAVGAALTKLTTPKVKVTIVHAGVGAITEGDVNLAIASKAIIVGFNVRPAGKASGLAESGGIEIRLYNIIYNAVDDIRSAMEGLLPTTKVEKPLGTAEIRAVFKITKVGIVAGCYVTQGLVRRGTPARVVRAGTVVYTGKIATLRHIKEEVKEIPEGKECGITLDSFSDIKEGDLIEAYEIEEVKQKLN